MNENSLKEISDELHRIRISIERLNILMVKLIRK